MFSCAWVLLAGLVSTGGRPLGGRQGGTSLTGQSSSELGGGAAGGLLWSLLLLGGGVAGGFSGGESGGDGCCLRRVGPGIS